MKLKLTIDHQPKHSDVATSVAWSTADTIFSLGDDHQLVMWNLAKNEITKVMELSVDLFPTSMQWPSRGNAGSSGAGRKGTDLLLVTATDGHFHLLGRGGRIEKTVQAHKGAVLCGHWNMEGSEILTSGEDGCVRIWSRAGMLRSTLAQCPEPIYGCAWSPDSLAVLYSVGSNLVIKPTVPQSKTLQWKAHEGVILCLSWSPTSKLIVSGAEDCRYKVWDSFGRSLYSSGMHTHPITSISWAPAGDLFSVGSFNVLRVCDRYGWSHCLEKLKTGSIYNMHWGADGTQFACATSSGHVVLASIIERTVAWGTFEAVLKARRTVFVNEFTGNTEDRLDFRDRVIKMSMDYGYLICVTTSQLYIYNVSNVNTPIVSELRENNSISLILQSPTHFILCGALLVSVWNYDGKQTSTVKWGGMRAEIMNRENSTLSADLLAFIDHNDNKLIRIFDPISGKALPELRNKSEIKQIALSRDNYPGSTDRQLAILDGNLDLLTVVIRKFGAPMEPKRLTTMVSSIMWHSEAPMMAVIRDSRLRIYYFPQIVFIDGALLDYTWEDRELTDLGRQPEILQYESNRISIRKADGVLIVGTASPFMSHLHSHAMLGKFAEARRICRYVNNKLVWGVMAGLASWKQDLSLAEICYSELELYDKVLFVQDIKMNSNDEPTRKALLAILSGNVVEAENILLQNGRLANAIELNVNCCKWERALELAVKGEMLIELVLQSRKEYLDDIAGKETLALFIEQAKKHPLSATKKRTKGVTKKRTKSSNVQETPTPTREQNLPPAEIENSYGHSRSDEIHRKSSIPLSSYGEDTAAAGDSGPYSSTFGQNNSGMYTFKETSGDNDGAKENKNDLEMEDFY